MRFNEIAIMERDQRTVVTMYHGTSTANLRSILKNGLLATPPKMTYSRDTKVDDSGYDSFGGIYITKDKPTASAGAANAVSAHGGEPIIITLEYVLNSGKIDEDDLTMALRVIIDQFYDDTSISDFKIMLQDDFGEIRDKIINSFLNLDKYRWQGFNGLNMKPSFKFTNSGRAALAEYVSYTLKYILNNASGDEDVARYMNIEFLENVRHVPEYDALCRKVLAIVGTKSNNVVRLERNIGFKGKTRIVSIVGRDGKVYYDEHSLKQKKNAAPIYFFFGNADKKYAWGSGKTKDEAMRNAKSGFKDFLESNDQYEASNFEDKWGQESKQCNLYPTDKYTYEYILANGFLPSVTNKDGMYVIPQK